MKYKKIKEENYDIYLVKSTKFKTIDITTVLINDYDYKDITKEKFISDYLVNSNEYAKNEVLMSKKYMELYEPRISITDGFRDKHIKTYSLTFLDEKYTEKGMNKKVIDFYYDIMFKPNIDDNGLEINSFNINKDAFKSIYNRNKEDSSSTAYFNALKNISEDNPLKYDYRGNLEDLEKIDRKEILNYYLDQLDRSKYIVFVTGDYNDEIISIIKENLKNVKNNDHSLKEYFDINKVKEERKVIDNSNFKQSILYMIYKINDMNERERTIILPVLNNILGGSSSKLFNNVREKKSLAYYAYSSIFPSYNILFMYAGISNNNYDEAVKTMKNELNEIIIGNITDDELNDAKESIYSGLLKKDDSINGIKDSIIRNVLFNYPLNEELIEKIKDVTKEDIILLASKLQLDVIYLLKGGKNNENN